MLLLHIQTPSSASSFLLQTPPPLFLLLRAPFWQASSSVVSPDYCVDPDDLIAFDGPPSGVRPTAAEWRAIFAQYLQHTRYRIQGGRKPLRKQFLFGSRQPVRRTAGAPRLAHPCIAHLRSAHCAASNAHAHAAADTEAAKRHTRRRRSRCWRGRGSRRRARGFSTARWRWW